MDENDEETAALLAELRAISMQSKSSSRFAMMDDNDNNHDNDIDYNNNNNNDIVYTSTTKDDHDIDDNTNIANRYSTTMNDNNNDEGKDDTDYSIPYSIHIPTTNTSDVGSNMNNNNNDVSTTIGNSNSSITGNSSSNYVMNHPTKVSTMTHEQLQQQSSTSSSSSNAVAAIGGVTTSNNTMSPYRSTTPPLSSTGSSSNSAGSPTKKNSVHLSIMQRHSPQILSQRRNSSGRNNNNSSSRCSSPATNDDNHINNNNEIGNHKNHLLLIPTISTNSSADDENHLLVTQLQQQQQQQLSPQPPRVPILVPTTASENVIPPLSPLTSRLMNNNNNNSSNNNDTKIMHKNTSSSILSAPSDELSSSSPQHGNSIHNNNNNNDKNKNTIRNGGSAEDAELLALLKDISKSSTSSSRFDNNSDITDVVDDINVVVVDASKRTTTIVDQNASNIVPANASSTKTSAFDVPSFTNPTTTVTEESTISLPPWKRRGSNRTLRAANGGVVEQTTPVKVLQLESKSDGNINDQRDDHVKIVGAVDPNASNEEPTGPVPMNSSSSDVPIHQTKSTYQGERGGAAEDAELLALLRGISSASSASRYNDDNGNDELGMVHVGSDPNPLVMTGSKDDVNVTVETTKSRSTKPTSAIVPPWKKRNSTTTNKFQSSTLTNDSLLPLHEEDIVTVSKDKQEPSITSKSSLMESEKSKSSIVLEDPQLSTNTISTNNVGGGGIKSDIASKLYQGERGGIAEDEELLALLRNVSSASNSRFSNDDDNNDNNNSRTNDATNILNHNETTSTKSSTTTVSMSKQRSSSSATTIPPWKKRGSATRTTSDHNTITVAIPNETDNLTSTDAVSATIEVAKETNLQSLSSLAIGGGGIKSDITSKPYQGERGGVAEDEELLALLRGVSSSSSANRFNDNVNIAEDKPITAGISKVSTTNSSSTTVRQQVPEQQPNDSAMSQSDAVPMPTSMQPDELIPIESIPTSLTDKNWKIRCQAYDTLSFILRDQVEKQNKGNDIDSNLVLPGLDERIHIFLEDSNAGALDKAIEFCLIFAEHCTGAGNADVARKIVSSMIQKNCFSSRPTTLKMSNALVLKLMEVSLDGNASVHSIVDVLLSEGLTSKKPKVISAAASLVLEATYNFGATSLPLATLTNAAPKMLAHSNATVRECCIKVLAEICRALGSRSPIQNVLDGMKKAQLSDFDSQLLEQPEPTPIRTGLRGSRHLHEQGAVLSSSPADAIAALQANAKELEAQRYAARKPVDLITAIAKSDYAEQINLSKWSEKVAALDKVLEYGGEKPYKLMQPSSSINYGPLVSEMKKLLAHTHFVVCSRAIQVIAMLAEGVGDKLHPHLRPTLTPLLQLSKDKKLTTEVSNGLDVLFGNVFSFETLLDNDDAVPSMVNEKLQKNALARATALTYLQRCVERRTSAGPKGTLSTSSSATIAMLCCNKLDDSDASVRKASLGVLESLLCQSYEADKSIPSSVQKVIEQLRVSNPRAYKTLSALNPLADTHENASAHLKASESFCKPAEKAIVQVPSRSRSAAPAKRPPSPAPKTEMGSKTTIDKPTFTNVSNSDDRLNMPRFEEAMIHVTSLAIPQWSAVEDECGILAGLKATKWQLRHDAIEQLRAFVESGGIEKSSPDVTESISCILMIVHELTRGFKETNVNIMKAILHLCIAICEYNESKEILIPIWAMKSMVSACVQKISDRKLITSCQRLLTASVVVSMPSSVIQAALSELKSVNSPVAHEEFFKWFQSFCSNFGALSLGRNLSESVPLLLEELNTLNAKVKREVFSSLSIMHRQIGPGFKSLVLSMEKNQSTKDQLQKCFEENPFDPTLSSAEWPRSSIIGRFANQGGTADTGAQILTLDIPKLDLLSTLPADIFTKLGSKDGKTAWKMRKEALDEIETALKNCNGLLETSPSQMKQLIDLARGLKERLTDLQINLRPCAARLVGMLISLVDSASQTKLCKVVLASLINEAMNDIKKPMRDASLLAIRNSVTLSEFDGGGINVLAIEPLLNAVVSEVNEAAIRTSGLPDVLHLLLSVIESVPRVDGGMVTRRQPVGDKFAAVLIDCLTSSKSETRSATLSLLDSSIDNGIINFENVKLATDRLKPALQRAVGPMIAKLAKKNQALQPPIENDMSKSGMDKAQGRIVSGEIKPRFNNKDQNAPRRVTSSSSPPKSSSIEPVHPLLLESGRHTSGVPRSIIWSEYPDEPHGSVFENLKRSWSILLPPSTASILFPSSGIRKQDEAKPGLDALSRALTIDRINNGKAILEQLDVVLKWFMFSLCSKESTTGLVDILAFGKDLFTFLIESGRELSDTEALDTVPLLFDKANCAKGRFRDTYLEINKMFENEALLSSKRMGMVCIAVIDSSPHGKAKAHACQISLSCIEKIGLAGFGKKGVMATAKMLSQETTMYRMSALDLMESILSKMNGDIMRLARICGQNLNEKGRQLLEERWHKNHSKDALHGSLSGGPMSTLQLQNQGSPRKNVLFGSQKDVEQKDIIDELPRLSLRTTGNMPSRPSPRKLISEEVQTTMSDSFTFTFSSGLTSPKNFDPESNVFHTDAPYQSYNSMDVEPSGAAAALRARLLKIREKKKLPEATLMNSNTVQNNDLEKNSSMEKVDLHVIIDSIESILRKGGPIAENDPNIENCLNSLKIIHSSLSTSNSASDDVKRINLESLRRRLLENVNQTVGLLRSLIGFAINSGNVESNAGMILPLLSLSLATLMALFRDDEFALVISTEELTLLLRETGSALLDPRLAASEDINDDTRSQMVRAINKLAVQAATSSARHTSFQALLTLQLQLTSNVNSNDDIFQNRLSRVVVKLFARVIKAEESVSDSYEHGRIDMEALICSLDDILVANEALQENITSDANKPCLEMVSSLLQSIVSIQGDLSTLQTFMEELGIDRNSSALGKVLSKFTLTNNIVSTVTANIVDDSLPNVPQPKTPSRDVASLVSRLGCAPQGEEREAALESIRAYQKEYGGDELHAHLQQLSGPFRDFILEQLHRDPSPQKTMHDSAGDSVSDRLRNLRFRLQASETSSPQKHMETEDEEAKELNSTSENIHAKDSGMEEGSAFVNNINMGCTNSQERLRLTSSSIVAPSPTKIPSLKDSLGTKKSVTPESKIPIPVQSRILPLASVQPSSSSAKSLRERLATRQSATAVTIQQTSVSSIALGTASDGVSNSDDCETISKSTTSDLKQSASLGRAAALRARLEFVKQQQSHRQ